MLSIKLLANALIWNLPSVDAVQADFHSCPLTDLSGKSLSVYAVKVLTDVCSKAYEQHSCNQAQEWRHTNVFVKVLFFVKAKVSDRRMLQVRLLNSVLVYVP